MFQVLEDLDRDEMQPTTQFGTGTFHHLNPHKLREPVLAGLMQ